MKHYKNFNYIDSLTNYNRVKTREVKIGDRPIGGENPIRLQSMTSTNTNEIQATIDQTARIVNRGADYVRITAQGPREAENMMLIKKRLLKNGVSNPIVADIHFSPEAALISAQHIEKVRINPGNYIDKKKFEQIEYTDVEYAKELEKIKENLRPLLQVCKENGTCIRIGVNHGSLSDRIMSRYGDTPLGMVMSLMEFLQVCKEENFYDIVLSIKASNTRIMVQACRMLIAMMKEEGECFPIHLGVTEAGEGEDGRIKSAVGIGTLLSDGIGDTIRVSLTEDPEEEIPVASKIVEYALSKAQHELLPDIAPGIINPYEYKRYATAELLNIGNKKNPIVVTSLLNKKYGETVYMPEYALVNEFNASLPSSTLQIINAKNWDSSNTQIFPLFTVDEFITSKNKSATLNFVKTNYKEFAKILESGIGAEPVVFIVEPANKNIVGGWRSFILKCVEHNISAPIIVSATYKESVLEDFQLKAASDFGSVFIDGLADGILIEDEGTISNADITITSYGILQASRVRFSKTEYISCPSCGRTLFNLQTTAKQIRDRTTHLKGLKIGIMGCIVNGPGEMADADYGYVGATHGHVTLYKEKKVMKTNVPSHEAVDELINLIKEHGDWIEPESNN